MKRLAIAVTALTLAVVGWMPNASAHGTASISGAVSVNGSYVAGTMQYYTGDTYHWAVWCYAALYRRPGASTSNDWTLVDDYGRYAYNENQCYTDTAADGWESYICNKDYRAYADAKVYSTNYTNPHLHKTTWSTITQNTC